MVTIDDFVTVTCKTTDSHRTLSSAPLSPCHIMPHTPPSPASPSSPLPPSHRCVSRIAGLGTGETGNRILSSVRALGHKILPIGEDLRQSHPETDFVTRDDRASDGGNMLSRRGTILFVNGQSLDFVKFRQGVLPLGTSAKF